MICELLERCKDLMDPRMFNNKVVVKADLKANISFRVGEHGGPSWSPLWAFGLPLAWSLLPFGFLTPCTWCHWQTSCHGAKLFYLVQPTAVRCASGTEASLTASKLIEETQGLWLRSAPVNRDKKDARHFWPEECEATFLKSRKGSRSFGHCPVSHKNLL